MAEAVYDFGYTDLAGFIGVAKVVENMGVSAYQGAAQRSCSGRYVRRTHSPCRAESRPALPGIDEVVLDPRAGRLWLIERIDMPVASARQFLRQRLVPLIERGEFAALTACFRVTAIALAVLSKNAPEPMELAMLTEQMLPAQQ